MAISKSNYRFNISYDGTRYYGWEHQPNIELTIQGKLESVLEKLVGEFVEIIGAGRTDAGVHARGMVFNASFACKLSEKAIRDYFNKYLPEDICVNDVKIVSDRFHSRYNAKGKTYCYTVYTGKVKPLFDRKYVYAIDELPDIERMKEAANYLMGEHDFASFCANPKMKKTTIRTVDKIDISRSGNYIKFTYHGSGFLQHMVRILTGTLLEVGASRMKPEYMNDILKSKDRTLAGPTAPASGLCLMNVDY